MSEAPETEGCAVVFAVSDLDASLAFYRDRLGFEVAFQWGAPGEAPYYAGVCRGDVTIHLNADPGQGRAPGGSLLSIFVKDADAFHDELRGRGVAVTVPIDTRSYGMRDFRVEDPDGNGVVFGAATDG